MSEVIAQEAMKEVKDVAASPKSRGIAMLLCFFLGWAGAHRYYTGRTGTGIMMLFTMGGFGMWWFIDLVMIGMGKFKDINEQTLINWNLK